MNYQRNSLTLFLGNLSVAGAADFYRNISFVFRTQNLKEDIQVSKWFAMGVVSIFTRAGGLVLTQRLWNAAYSLAFCSTIWLWLQLFDIFLCRIFGTSNSV